MKFIINLNGTILCPYQIISDLTEQIPDCPPQIKHMVFAPVCDLNATNDWINLESLGKPVAIRAKILADTVAALLKKQNNNSLALDISCTNGHLTSDNLYILLFLSQSLNTLELTFFTTPSAQESLKALLEPLAAQKNTTLNFKTTLQQSTAMEHLEHTRIQSIHKLGFTLNDATLTDTILNENSINQLIGYSWICLKAGANDIACQLLEKAATRAGTSAKAQEHLFMHLLMIRFFSHQYALVTESAFPEEFTTLSSAEVRTLRFLKAYSATLSRNLDVANQFFTTCGIHEDMPLSDETSLYQLNLFALSRVLRGEIELAFALEFRIKEYIAEQKMDVVGLKYVNFINIARLYKKTQEFELSLDYYNKAYDQISGGGYTTSDHIYYNMNLGSLHEAANNHQQALQYWVKAAIHWLACDNKYVLSWRPRLILCSEKLTDISRPLPIDKANQFLLDKISTLIKVCAVDVDKHAPEQWQFVEDLQNIKKELCFIHEHIVLYSSKENTAAFWRNTSGTEQALSRLVSQYIQATLDIPQDRYVFIIDTHLDTIPLRNAKEASAYAQLSHCSACYFNNQWIKLQNTDALKTMTVSLSKAIAAIVPTDKGLAVQYKRSFLNKILIEQSEIDLVNQLQKDHVIDIANTTENTRMMLQQLAQKRVLNFSYAG